MWCRSRIKISKLCCRFELWGFFENLEQPLCAINSIAFCAADFLHDASSLQLPNGSHDGVICEVKTLLRTAWGEKRIGSQQFQHLKGNLCVRIARELVPPLFQ